MGSAKTEIIQKNGFAGWMRKMSRSARCGYGFPTVFRVTAPSVVRTELSHKVVGLCNMVASGVAAPVRIIYSGIYSARVRMILKCRPIAGSGGK